MLKLITRSFDFKLTSCSWYRFQIMAPSKKRKNKDEPKEPSSKRERKSEKEVKENIPAEGQDAKLSKSADNSDGDQLDSAISKEVKLKTSDGRLCNFKLISWNVAGVRAWVKKDGHKWLIKEDPDIICLQETKCSEKDIPPPLKDMTDYNQYWNESKSKKGFSGVALFSKIKPQQVDYGMGVEEHDQEGRTITAEYENFYVVTTYVPNSQRGLKRLGYRMKWNEDFLVYLKGLNAKKPVILCGDLNVSHLEIDLANPKSNKNNAGFTQQERDGMTTLLQNGFEDTFRYLYPDNIGKYTFWTYIGNARGKNVGWRLDYFIVSKSWVENVCDNVIASSAMGSDHCPIKLLVALPQ